MERHQSAGRPGPDRAPTIDLGGRRRSVLVRVPRAVVHGLAAEGGGAAREIIVHARIAGGRMPFTPFHIGVGVAAKAALPAQFSLSLFVALQVLTDLESL